MPSFKLDPNKIDEIIDQIPIADLETFVAKVLKIWLIDTDGENINTRMSTAINELLIKVQR